MVKSGELSRRLRHLASQFKALLDTHDERAVRALYDRSHELEGLCQNDVVIEGDEEAVKAALLALAQQLEALDAPLLISSPEEVAGPDGSGRAPLSYGILQAACAALRATATLGGVLQLPRADALRLACAARLVFTAGRVLLGGYTDVVHSMPDAHPELGAAAAWLERLAACQVAAVHAVSSLLTAPGQMPELAAAWARSTAAPSSVLPWLEAVCQALLLSDGAFKDARQWAAAEAPPALDSLPHIQLTELCHLLLGPMGPPRHREALAAAPSAGHALIRCLLLRRTFKGLRRMTLPPHSWPGGATRPETVRRACAAVPKLLAVLLAAMQCQPGAASERLACCLADTGRRGADAVRSIATLLYSLRLRTGARCGVPARVLVDARVAAAQLLAVVSQAVMRTCQPPLWQPQQPPPPPPPPQQQQHGRTGAAGAEPADEEQGFSSQLLAASECGVTFDILDAIAFGQALQQMATSVRALSASGRGQAATTMAAALSTALEAALKGPCMVDVDRHGLLSWAHAAEACLRLLPDLWRQVDSRQSLRGKEAAGLPQRILSFWVEGSHAAWQATGITSWPLWQLHSAACRLLQQQVAAAPASTAGAAGGTSVATLRAKAAPAEGGMAPGTAAAPAAGGAALQLGRQAVGQLLKGLHGILLLALEATAGLLPEQEEWSKELPAQCQAVQSQHIMPALCLAHYRAIQAVAGLAGDALGPSIAHGQLLPALCAIASHCPGLADEAFCSLVRLAVAEPLEGSGGCSLHAAQAATYLLEWPHWGTAPVHCCPALQDTVSLEWLWRELHNGQCRRRLAAALSTSGVLRRLLLEADRMQASPPGERGGCEPVQPVLLPSVCFAALAALAEAAEELGGSRSAEDSCSRQDDADSGGRSSSSSSSSSSGGGSGGGSGSSASSVEGQGEVKQQQPGLPAALSCLQERMAHAAAALQEAEEAAQGGGESTLRPAVQALQQALGPSAQVADCLWQHWQRPEQQAAVQLALAQAAAARSCANACCPNVALRGGPDAAGFERRTMRCRGCMAVWYCGRECEKADWQAGHRRVCKQLEAARIAQELAGKRQVDEKQAAAAAREE
ncbi:hypothetical protein ABPG75_010722 [Micractinium tetrahymenae]